MTEDICCRTFHTILRIPSNRPCLFTYYSLYIRNFAHVSNQLRMHENFQTNVGKADQIKTRTVRLNELCFPQQESSLFRYAQARRDWKINTSNTETGKFVVCRKLEFRVPKQISVTKPYCRNVSHCVLHVCDKRRGVSYNLQIFLSRNGDMNDI